MPELRLLPLDEILSATEIAKVTAQLEELGVAEIPAGDDVVDLDDEELSESQYDDFAVRLEAHDVAASIYLPAEFEGVIQVGDHTVGSAYTLLEALAELREELDLDDEAEEAEEEEEADAALAAINRELGHAWRVYMRGAATCTKRQVPLLVLT